MQTPGAQRLLHDGWAALEAADFDAARSSFEQALAEDETPEALDGLARACQFQRDYARAMELMERAFAAHRSAGDPAKAADLARSLAFMHASVHGNFAAAGGWIARAEGVLDGVAECPAHGWLVLDHAPFSRDPDERERYAAAALTIAARFGDAALEAAALALKGEAYVASGRLAEGMKLLDRAMAAVTGGEVDDRAAAGEICCRLLGACEHAMDVTRAEQWMALADRHVGWTDFVRPTCRTHYGGILVALGRWPEAEAELLAAIATFERGYRADRAFALVRLADLRVRQGRYEEAERLLEGVEWHPTARRAAAAIAYARGDLALAAELTELCLDGDADDAACAPLLELLLSVQLAREDREAADRTLGRLAAVASASGDPLAEAFAALAAGRAGGADAARELRRALEGFAELNLPLEAARARLELARALGARSPEAAASEARLALADFERLGAARDADRAAALLRELGAPGRAWPRGRGSITKREAEVLELLAAGLSNADIAGRLYISRRTAEHHVASILGKLGLRSRAEAAAYALRRPPEDR
jgi:DNA-binding NarL/FixJ family response regulator